MKIPPAHDRYLIQELHVGGRYRCSELGNFLFGHVIIAVASTDNLIDGDALQVPGKVFKQA